MSVGTTTAGTAQATPQVPPVPSVATAAPPNPPQPTEGGTPNTPDWREVLKGVDPKELLSDSRIAGVVGSKAQEIARKLAADTIAQQSAHADAARRRELRDSNPDAYAEEDRRREQAAALAQAGLADTDKMLDERFYLLSPESQAKLAGKVYQGEPMAARRAYLADLDELRAEDRLREQLPARLAEERKKWEKDVLPALTLQANTATVGREPSPDRGGGSSAASGAMTQDEFNQIRRNPALLRAAMDRVDQGLAQGLITR